MDAQTETIRAAADTVEAEKGERVSGEVTLSNGIVLMCSPIPPFLLRQAGARIEEPKIPTFHNEAKDRDEENPEDPDYKQALIEYRMRVGDAAMNVMLALGTEVKFVPDGVFAPDDEGWVERITAVEIDVPVESETARYISWLRFYAIATTDDLNSLTRAVGESASVKEEDVAQAAKSFRSGKGRGADSEPDTPAGDQNGDKIRPANRRARRGGRRA